MFWRMVGGALFRQKKKMAMVAMTIALGISLATALMNVMLGVGDKINKELKVYGANISVVPKDASLLDDLYGLQEGAGVNDKYLYEADAPKIKQIFWGYNIVDFAPYLKVRAKIVGTDDQILLVGTWFAKELNIPTGETLQAGVRNLKTWWRLQGDWPADADTKGAIVGYLLAQQNGWQIGSRIKVEAGGRQQELIVRSLLNAGGDEDKRIYTNLQAAQQLADLEGKISGIDVSALTTPDNALARKASVNPDSLTPTERDTWYCTAYTGSICYQIQEVVRDGVAKPIRQVAESEGTILNKTKLLMLLITVLSSIGSALGISNLVTASVMERGQEIGLIKAVGGRDIRIIILILTEIILTGLIGGTCGYVIGLGFAQIIGLTVFGTTIPLAIMVIPIDLIVLLAVILVGSIPAIRYLLCLKPTEVLHGR